MFSQVLPVNEHDPVWEAAGNPTGITWTLSEDVATGFNIETIGATDEDSIDSPDGVLKYSLVTVLAGQKYVKHIIK